MGVNGSSFFPGAEVARDRSRKRSMGGERHPKLSGMAGKGALGAVHRRQRIKGNQGKSRLLKVRKVGARRKRDRAKMRLAGFNERPVSPEDGILRGDADC